MSPCKSRKRIDSPAITPFRKPLRKGVFISGGFRRATRRGRHATRRRTGSSVQVVPRAPDAARRAWALAFAICFARRRRQSIAVDRLSFSIAPGERVAFIGPNGAGKSTTLKVLAGILHPDAGEVRVLGLVPSRERRRLAFQIGTVFGQRSQLWYQLPPRDTFELLGRVYEIDRRQHRRRIDALTSVFEIGALVDTPVRQLSLGERMRCEIVASLLHSPRMLFLDEPTIGLDVSAKAVIRELLRTESERERVTLLLTSHDTGDMERVCTRAIVIHHGRLLWDGAIAELRRGYLKAKRITLWTEAEHLESDAARRARAVVGLVPDGARDRARDHAARSGRRRRGASGRNQGHGHRGCAARRRHPGPVRERGTEEGDVMTRLVAKYAAFSRVAIARACRERGDVYGRVAFFAVILGVFSSLWRAAAEAGLPTATEPESARLVPGGHRVDSAERAADPSRDPGGDPPGRRRLPARPSSVVRGRRARERTSACLRCGAPLLGLTAFLCAFAFTGWIPPLRALADRRAVRPGGRGALVTALDLVDRPAGLLAPGRRRPCTGCGRS